MTGSFSSEIAQLKLNADWVVLSACNTASAMARQWRRFVGFGKSFFYAAAVRCGVEWPVDRWPRSNWSRERWFVCRIARHPNRIAEASQHRDGRHTNSTPVLLGGIFGGGRLRGSSGFLRACRTRSSTLAATAAGKRLLPKARSRSWDRSVLSKAVGSIALRALSNPVYGNRVSYPWCCARHFQYPAAA